MFSSQLMQPQSSRVELTRARTEIPLITQSGLPPPPPPPPHLLNVYSGVVAAPYGVLWSALQNIPSGQPSVEHYYV